CTGRSLIRSRPAAGETSIARWPTSTPASPRSPATTPTPLPSDPRKSSVVLRRVGVPSQPRRSRHVSCRHWRDTTIQVDTHIDGEPSVDEVARAVATLKLLADDTRLRIVWNLLHGEHNVNDL